MPGERERRTYAICNQADSYGGLYRRIKEMRTMSDRDGDHYRRIARGGPTFGASLAATAVETAQAERGVSVSHEGLHRLFLGWRYRDCVPAAVVLRLMDAPPSRLPRAAWDY